MFWTTIGFLILTLTILFWYKCLIQPRKVMKWHADEFKKRGYKVLDLGYDLFHPSVLKTRMDPQSHPSGDAISYCKKQFPHYDLILFNLGPKIIISIAQNTQLVQDFLSRQNVYVYYKDSFFFECFADLFGISLPTSEGNEWKKRNRVLCQVTNVKIANICDQAMNYFENQKNDKQAGQYQYGVQNYAKKVASLTIFECFFNQKFTGQKIQGVEIEDFINDIVDGCGDRLSDPLIMLFGKKTFQLEIRKRDRELNRKIKIYHAWGKKIIQQRMQSFKSGQSREKPRDILEALLNDREKESDSPYQTQQSILNEFSTFLAVGTDTTAYYIAMMIYLIAKNPEIDKKVREQIDQYLNDDNFSYENIKKCTYMDYVQLQATRFYGPANGPIPRKALKDNFIKDIPIKKGILVSYSATALHFSEQFYKDPWQFRPERWIEECKNNPTYALIGFSGGPRTCIGKHLARLEAKIGVIKFMKRYKKIQPKQHIKMFAKFAYKPEDFETKLTKA